MPAAANVPTPNRAAPKQAAASAPNLVRRDVLDSRRVKRNLSLIGGTLLSLLFLWLAFRRVDLQEVWGALREADPLLVALALFTFLVTQVVKSVRWKTLFYPEHRSRRLTKLLKVIVVGQMVNAAIPARLGEVARAYLLGKIERISTAYAFGTIVLEKALDSLMLLLLVLLISIFMPLPVWLKGSSLVVSGGMVLLLIVMTLLSRWEDRLPSWLDKVLGPGSWLTRVGVTGAVQRAALSLRPLRSLRLNAQLWGWSLLNWLIMISTNVILLWAFGLHLPWTAAPVLLAILNIGIIVPSSPGRIGIFHYLCVLTLGLYNVEPSTALAYGIVLHALVYLPIFLFGAYFLWRENYDLSHLAELASSDEL